jgi:hypothetical protein
MCLPVSSEAKEEKKERELMSIINKPPEMVKREYELQEPIAVAVEKYAAFIASTPDHVVNSAPENPWARILGLIEPLKPIPNP